MTAPSTFHNTTHDGRVDMEPIDLVESPAEEQWTSGRAGGALFSARYAGVCAACTGPIKPGDSVAYGLDEQLEHGGCPEVLVVGPKGVCGGCFLEIPLSGVCGVCE